MVIIISPSVCIATPIRNNPKIRMIKCVPASQSFFIIFPQNMTTRAVIILARVIAMMPGMIPLLCIDMTYAIPGAENVSGKTRGTMSHLLRYSWMIWSHSTVFILVASISSHCTIENAMKKRMIAPAIRKYSVLSQKNARRYCPRKNVVSIAIKSTRPSLHPSLRYSRAVASGWSFE